MELISDYFTNSKAQIVRDIIEDQHLFKRFYHMRWFQKTREVHHSSNDIFGNPAKLLVHLITSVSKLLKEYCDYVNQILSEKIKITTNKQDEIETSKYKAILQVYCFFWKNFSSAIVSIDQSFSRIN